ncbi:MAG: YggS family pyridoxal phosphate-dependent enzyme [Chloroflexota bacterium]|nr:YggS family pyridoxal phosphate-dependent enzyme [Chloroflexota bacterium]
MLKTLTIAARVALVREQIVRAATSADRDPASVRLMAVSKTAPVEAIEKAIEAGITLFGENRVQEAESKFGVRRPLMSGEQGSGLRGEKIDLHMVGSLQRNKAKRAALIFDCVQSVDRADLAIDLEHATEGKGTVLPVLLEVNLTGEASKSGVSPELLPALADTLALCPHLKGLGLMTVARIGSDERELRETFTSLRGLLERLQTTHPGEWRELSMGMSGDFEAAIKEGATIVRIGRAIFGERGVN